MFINWVNSGYNAINGQHFSGAGLTMNFSASIPGLLLENYLRRYLNDVDGVMPRGV